MHMPIGDPGMQRCIEDCLSCARTCQAMLSRHCLEVGGRHVEPEHVRLMLACVEICRAAGAIMLIGVAQHRESCRACAAICAACAESCRQVGDMDECVEACDRCVESCGEMAASG